MNKFHFFSIFCVLISSKLFAQSESQGILAFHSLKGSVLNELGVQNNVLKQCAMQSTQYGCIDLSNDTIDIGIIQKSKHQNFYFDIKNVNGASFEIEKIELDKMLDYTNMYNKETHKYDGSFNYGGTVLNQFETKRIELTLYPARGGTGNTIQRVSIKYKNGVCSTEYIYIYSTIFDNFEGAIKRGNQLEINRLVEKNAINLSMVNLSQRLEIGKIIPKSKKFSESTLIYISQLNSIEDLEKIVQSMPEFKQACDERFIELGNTIPTILRITDFNPDLKFKFREKLNTLASNFRNCEDVIGSLPEWKNEYESKMANFISNSNELDRFLRYFPNSLNKAKLIQKISLNPSSFEDVLYVVAIDPSYKSRMESKAFEMLPKYASSEQCRQFITIYPNSTYKGMVEAQYQAALMDERVNKTMDEKLRQQQQAQPKDDRCYACGGRGVCLECNGRGTKVCDYHDTDGDGHCTHCDDRGYLVCSKCDGKGTCSSCRGKGRRN